MVAVMVVMSFALVLGGVAVEGSVRARGSAVKDVRAKRAQQAADAGLSATIYRLNQLSLANVNFSGGLSALSRSVACQGLLKFGTTVNVGFADVAAATGDCGSGRPAVPNGSFFNEPLGDHTDATGYVSVGPTAVGSTVATLAPTRLQPVVVSVGRDTNGTATTSDDVVRRVRAILEPVRPFQAVEATNDLTFAANGLATTTTLNGSAQANGNVTFSGSALSLNTFVNANLSVAPLNVTGSVAYDGAKLTSGLVSVNLSTLTSLTEPPVARTAVTVSPTKPDCPSTGCPAGYVAATHALVATSGTVTLPGGDYVFCKVSLGSSTTIRPVPTSGTPVRIFVDSPSSARCSPNTGVLANNGDIAVTGRIDPGVSLQPSQLQFYVAGPARTPAPQATFDTTTSALSLLPGFFFYGPTADVTLKYSTFQGNVVGRDVRLISSGVSGVLGVGTFTQDLNVNNLPLSSELGVFAVNEYGECSARTVTAATSTQDC